MAYISQFVVCIIV